MLRSFFSIALAFLAFAFPLHAQYTVTSTSDLPDADLTDNVYSPATLRSALQNANKKNVATTITISPLIATDTFYIESGLPVANIELTFEGNGVTLAPSAGSSAQYGFWVTSNNSTIRNVQIQNFNGSGLVWQGSDGLIELITCRNNHGPGLNMNSAHRNTIGSTLVGYYSNVFYGNTGNGGSGIVLIESDNNIIQYCAIGINRSGDIKPNERYGIHLDESHHTLIQYNHISGNDWSGIYIYGDNVPCYSVVKNNYIGTDQFGTTAKPNGNNGIYLYLTSKDSIVNNVVSGNSQAGIIAQGDEIVIVNNRIGTNRAANSPIPNGAGISCAGKNNLIRDNVVSGNTGTGIAINGSLSEITNNIIGLDSAQTKAVPNGDGMSVVNYSDDYLVIGDSTGKLSNIIAGNLGNGIHIIGATVKNIYIVQNSIGANKDSVPFANGKNGILITHSVNYIDIAHNLISANKENGIKIIRNVVRFLDTTQPNIIQRPGNVYINNNCIGCASVKDAVGEIGGSGIYMLAADTINVINNYIYGTAKHGVFVDDSSHFITIKGNDFGPNYSKNQKTYIQGDGIRVSYASDVLIGSQVEDSILYNTIYYCKGHGIAVTDSASLVNIFGNYMYMNEKGGIALDDLDNYFASFAFNDPLDKDSGSNGLQNTIVMQKAVATGNKAEILGFLTGKPNTTYRIDPFLAQKMPDSIQNKVQGVWPLKWFTLKTDSLGFANIDTSWNDKEIGWYSANYPFVTLTVTGPEGTSQFSRIIPDSLFSISDILVKIDTILSEVNENGTVAMVANITNNGPNDAFLIQVRDSVTSQYTHQSVSISKGVALFVDSVYIATIPSLKKGETAVYKVVGSPKITGLHFRKVYAKPTGKDPFPGNNSDTISFNILKVNAIKETKNLKSARLYQTGKNKLRIVGFGSGNVTIRVINLLGQVYAVNNFNIASEAPIDLDVPQGLQIVEVYSNEKQVFRQKIFIK